MRLALLAVVALLLVSTAVPVGALTTERGVTPHTLGPSTNHANATVDPTLSRARGGLFAELTSPEALRTARERGAVVDSRLPFWDDTRRAFVPGDLLVLRLESSRLAASLRERPEATTTARFRGYLNDTDARLRMIQTYDTTTPQRERKQVLVAESRIRVLADGDVRWVLLDTGNASLLYGTDGARGGPAELREEEAYGVWFAFDGERDLPDAAGHSRITVAEPAAEFDASGGEQVFLSPDDATLRVRSTLAPGSTVRLRADLPDRTVERTLTLRGENTTRANTTLSLGGLPEGRTVELRLLRGNETLDRTEATVDVPSARLAIGPRDPWDLLVTVSGELSRGGVVAVEAADGSVRYDSERVGPGSIAGLQLFIDEHRVPNRTRFRVVAYRHVDGDGTPGSGDVPYEMNGSAVTDTGVVDRSLAPTPHPTTAPPTTTPPTPTPTPTPGTATPTPGTARPPSPTPTVDTRVPPTTADGGQAGFGPLVALLALLFGALTAARR